ncbi:hypothetical protein Drorol1_Dr00013464 [Drosera rotundifolia]
MRRTWVFWCCLLVLVMHIMTWVSATSRNLAPNHHHHGLQTQETGSIPDSLRVEFTPRQNTKGEEGYKEEKKIGSRPPSCENKCYGCSPCDAIQVPTISVHYSVQYANYFPEGWKCKCGHSFYTP